jgi:hypothetical protein
MKCECGNDVDDGLIRCGNCGRKTAAAEKYKTEYRYRPIFSKKGNMCPSRSMTWRSRSAWSTTM